MELKKATKLAELATSSVDGFKLMLQEKLRLENEMKKKYSAARLRWVKAINRIMVQNYVKNVKIRLLSTPYAYYVKDEEECVENQDNESICLEEDTPSTKVEEKKNLPPKKTRPRLIRRSIDNSHFMPKNLSNSSLPSLMHISISTPSVPVSMLPIEHFPLLTDMSKEPSNHFISELSERRQKKKKKSHRRTLSRSSFDNLKLPSSMNIDHSAPSLLQSYSTHSQKNMLQNHSINGY